MATLIGTLVGAPLAIVGSTLFAGFGTLLLMQPRVLFATLVVALLLVLLALLLLDFRMFPTMLACLVFAVVAAFELGGATFGAILFRFETLLAFGDFGALFTSLAIRAVLAFGLERLAALVLATVLVTSAGTVASGASTVFRETVAALAMPATRIARRLGLLKRPTETRFGRLAHQFQHFRGIVGHFDRLDLQSGLMQHAAGAAALVRQNDGHHITGMAGSRGTSGAVKERFRVLRRLHLHHELHAGHVDAAGGHIGGDHDVHVAGFEGCEIAVTLVLAQVAVQLGRRNAVLRQVLGELLGLEFGAGEQDAASLAGSEGADQLMTVALRGFEHVVGHFVDGRGGGVDAVDLRIGEERVHHLVDAMVEGGGEQHDLRVERHLAEQALDRRQEAHVGHFVGFVDHGHFDLLQGQRMLFEQVLKTARACDDDIGAGP